MLWYCGRVAGRRDCPSQYTLQVELLSADQKVLEPSFETTKDLGDDDEWIKVQLELQASI